MNKRARLKELRLWATERAQRAMDENTIVSRCCRCGIILGTKPAGRAGGGYSDGFGPLCVVAQYPELAGRI